MKNFYASLMLILIVVSSHLIAQSDYRILLRSGALIPVPNLEKFISEQSPATTDIMDGYYYRFIQFNTIPNTAQKAIIASVGIKLLDYIPRNTFMAAVPVGIDKSLLHTLNIRCVMSQEPVQKINKNLFGPFPDYAVVEKGTVDIIIQYQQNMNEERIKNIALSFGKLIGSNKIM